VNYLPNKTTIKDKGYRFFHLKNTEYLKDYKDFVNAMISAGVDPKKIPQKKVPYKLK
jgi:hypothetical protein